MVLSNGEINIIADMEGTTGVKLHNNRQKLRARFDIRRKLGQGTYGKVQLAVNKETGEEVAIKTIKKSKIETEQDLVRIQREIQIMSSVQHPHIIHIYEVFENREKIVLVMEYASGGELYDYLSFKKVLTESEARRVFRQVASAVFYCHKNMICHRDLKLENILLDERGNAKIADFGLSNIFNERNFLSTFCGSPLYASPEIVQGTPYYGPEVDCWSLGVLLYTLVYGAMPFDGSNFKKLVKQISEGDYYEPRVPADASGLIRKMLTVDPAKRANVDDICCDRWVDISEEVPLLEVAEEMCKLMPVRLDYLLALTAGPPPPEAEENGNKDTPNVGLDANGLIEDISCQTNDAKSAVGEDEDDTDQWERPALQALASATGLHNKDAQVNGELSKKHKLTPSSSILGGSTSIINKKKKSDDKLLDDDNDKGGGAEKISQPVEPMEAESVENITETITPVTNGPINEIVPKVDGLSDENETKFVEALVEEQSSKPSEQANGEEQMESKKSVDSSVAETANLNATEPKMATDSTLVKRKPSINKKSPSLLASNGTAKPKKNQTDVLNSESDAKVVSSSTPANRNLKLKKSMSKDGGTQSPNETGAPTPPSAGTERRKISFPPSRISDVKKSFERKSPEKKPISLSGSKISSVRNKFESPPTTPESASPSVKPPAKSLGSSSSLTKAPIVKSISQSKESQDSKVEDAASETENAKKSTVLTRMPSTGNVRKSPTKNIRNDKATIAAAEQGGQHHKGCVPHDAKLAAAQEAKKSPPKTILFKRKSPPLVPTADASNRKNSLSKTGSGISRINSKDREAPLARRPSAGNGSSSTISHTNSSTGLRPRSPTKPLKGKTSTIKRIDPTPPTTSAEPEAITETAKIEEKIVTNDDSVVQNDVSTPNPAQQISDKGKEKSELEVDKAETKNEKRGSIEIAPLPSSALVRRYPEEDEEGNMGVGTPLVRFIPRDQTGFHLIGVKSEVLFDVAAGEQENGTSNMVPTTVDQENESNDRKIEPEEDSKIIRYIATVRRHGSTDDQLDDGPERVTLLDLRCSTTSDDLTGSRSSNNLEIKNSKPAESAVAKQEIKTSAKSEERSTQVEDSPSTEQRGYSVYRSKYRSIQKFRSVVEKRGGEEGDVREENASTKESVDNRRAPSLERSDSFSSTGSNDDLEDVFESLTSESLFTSLLSRTRNLINRLTEGDAHTTRWFQSNLLGRSGIGISGTIPSSVSSFVFNTPNISVRFNQPASSSRRNYSDSPKSTYRISARGSEVGRSNSAREYDAETSNYASDSGNDRSRCTPRWRVKAQSGEDEEDMAFMSDTGGSSRLRGNINIRSQSSYTNFNSNRSVLVSSSLRSKEDLAARRSRYDAFRTRDWQAESPLSQREEARSDVLSALLRHRNRSLDTRTRPRSFYESEPHESEWSSASKSTLPPSPRPTQANSEAPEMDRESLYGTVRRPTRFQRYSKSVSKELSEEYESEESNLHRPRSMVVLPEAKDGKAASVSVSRDYKKNVSQTGNTKKEEEEEYEHEHRITKEEGGRVTTTRRETKRSVSQTQDTNGGAEIQNAEVLNRPIKKQGSGNGDHLSRQDSGIGSMHDSSAPATPTSAGIQPRKGYARFARSVSNELESLEEEINRIGLGATKPTKQSDGEQGRDGGDGRTTPASDSAETGSVCSDTASTDTLNSSHQQQKESEEESVGDRIRRKSFFARFNESSRIPRKGRIPGSTVSASSSTASMRSELSRTPSFRHHHHFYDEEPAFTSSRSYFDPSPDFYSTALNRHGGANQRWSMHLGGNSSPGSNNPDYLYGSSEMPSSSSRRRGSNGGNPDVMAYLRRSADTGNEDCGDPGMMNRTHSLPEEESPPSRPVFRQHSMPSGNIGNGNCPAGSENGDQPATARRPSRLGLRTRNYPSTSACEETGEMLATSPSATSTSGRSWRRSRFGSGNIDPLDAWDTSRNRAGPSFSSLMGTLESPSEVLQKAMDLCDSLRFS